jgi:hypothetical protein
VSRSLGPSLPDALLDRLTAGDPPEEAVVLATVDAYGWPHPALMSYAALAALDAGRLRLAVHAGSRSARHLRDGGRATLVFADGTLCLYVKGEALALPPVGAWPDLARFELVVRDVLEDAARGEEAGARLRSGLAIAWAPGRGTTASRRGSLRGALLA